MFLRMLFQSCVRVSLHGADRTAHGLRGVGHGWPACRTCVCSSQHRREGRASCDLLADRESRGSGQRADRGILKEAECGLKYDYTGYEPKRIELNRILVNPQNQIIDDQDGIEEIGVKPLSYSQSLIHSAYDSLESIATPPDSDLEDEQSR